MYFTQKQAKTHACPNIFPVVFRDNIRKAKLALAAPASARISKYCFADGEFKKQSTMEEWIEDDIRFWIGEDCKTPEEAREKMRKVFPTLKRWRKE